MPAPSTSTSPSRPHSRNSPPLQSIPGNRRSVFAPAFSCAIKVRTQQTEPENQQPNRLAHRHLAAPLVVPNSLLETASQITQLRSFALYRPPNTVSPSPPFAIHLTPKSYAANPHKLLLLHHLHNSGDPPLTRS